ncbi:MAG: DUF3326 domain-containing protein [Cyanobacteria bacterium P01_F01_bin.53]
MHLKRSHTTVLIVPTGIGAAIGGYAGDALPVARAVAQVTDRLITHPNVMNGAQMYWPMENAYYVEGYGLDQFAAGHWGLKPVHQNAIGLVIDQAMEAELRWRHFQAADAARATLGLNVSAHVVTDMPLGVTLKTADSGASWGTLENPDSLLRAAERLITEAGVGAIAVIARFPDDEGSAALQAYRQGEGVDGLAGAEAVISHLIVRTFEIPCAHAPALAPIPLDPSISPRSAAEELGYTFLPCVLAGLSRAPQFVSSKLGADLLTDVHTGTGGRDRGDVHSHQASPGIVADSTISQAHPAVDPAVIWSAQVDAVIVPATAFGGSAVMNLAPLLNRQGGQVIAVGDNSTTMSVRAADLGIRAISVGSYLEAIGAIAAYQAGVTHTALRPETHLIPSLDKCHS